MQMMWIVAKKVDALEKELEDMEKEHEANLQMLKFIPNNPISGLGMGIAGGILGGLLMPFAVGYAAKEAAAEKTDNKLAMAAASIGGGIVGIVGGAVTIVVAPIAGLGVGFWNLTKAIRRKTLNPTEKEAKDKFVDEKKLKEEEIEKLKKNMTLMINK